MIIHIPHASTEIPQLLRSTLHLSNTELRTELLRVTDWYTDQLFDIQDATQICYPVSRIIVDPERFEDDNSEPAAKLGFGAIYTKTTTGKILRSSSGPHRVELLDHYYRPHHKQLTLAVEHELKVFGSAFIVDAHSFPDDPLPFELPISSPLKRPDICVGTDGFHTPIEVTEYLASTFEEMGYSVSINVPFSGTIVPEKFYGTENRVRSVMIEINRRLYLKPESSEKSRNFDKLRSDLHSVVNGLQGLAYRAT